MSNPFIKYIEQCEANPQYCSIELLLLIKKQRELLKRYDFIEEKGAECVNWIERFCLLVDGENAGTPVKLLLWQKWFIYSIFCFYGYFDTEEFNEDGEIIGTSKKYQRLINDVLLVVASGNAKTTLVAMINAYCLFSKQFKACKIFIGSNSYKQSRLCFDTTSKILYNNKSLRGYVSFRNSYGELEIKQNGAKLVAMSSDGSNLEGIIPTILIIDEIHEMKDNVIVKSIEQSQSLKINPKLIFITTEGFVNDGFLDNELIHARAILNGEITNETSKRYLPWLYTQDSEQEIWQGNRENRLWMKSNPTIGKIKRWNYLEQQIDAAREKKQDRAFVLSKDFNIKQSNAKAWLASEDYDYEEVFDLEDFKGALCLGGVDIAETTDLCAAKVLLMKANDSRKYIYSMYFIPEGKLTKSDDKSAGAKYEEWARKGQLRILDGNYIDTSQIADWFFELYKKHGLRIYLTGYDAKFANEFINKMDSYGFETESIWQRPEIMSSPINMVEADLKDRLIIGLNEMDKWCLGNATLKLNNSGFGILEKIKGQASRKIDGAVALCILYETYRRHRTEFESNLS